MRLPALFACLALACGLFAGCASTQSTADTDDGYERSRVSTVPWNKPASWEGTTIGGANPGM